MNNGTYEGDENPNGFWPSKESPNVVGKFEMIKTLDVAASKAADEKKYREVLAIRTKVVGSSDETAVPIKPHNQKEYVRRFPQAWRAFDEQGFRAEGTPISDLDGVEGEKILTMKLAGVMTVEQLANASDSVVSNLGFGASKLREAARKHLGMKPVSSAADSISQSPAMAALAEENAELKRMVSAQSEQMQKFMEMMQSQGGEIENVPVGSMSDEADKSGLDSAAKQPPEDAKPIEKPAAKAEADSAAKQPSAKPTSTEKTGGK